MKTWFKYTVTAGLVLAAAHNVEAQSPCSRPGPSSGTCTYDSAMAAAAGTKLKGVLLYQYSVGGHNQTGLNNSLVRLSNRYGFKLDRSSSSSYITSATLNGIDVVIANQTDTDPFSNSTSLTAMKNFVEVQGKALWMNHAAGAYIPCSGEDLTNSGCRWALRTIRTQFWIHNNPRTPARLFADTVGIGQIPANATGAAAVAATRNHGLKNDETKNIFSNNLLGAFRSGVTANVAHPLPQNGGTSPVASSHTIWDGVRDEWYNYRNIPRLEGERTLDGVVFGPINVLITLDEASQPSNVTCSDGSNCKNKGTLGDRSQAWTRKVGNGNALYWNAGHEDVYLFTRNQVGGSTVSDTLVEKLNWRFLKYLARDFQGCMNLAYREYNPDATVEVLNPIDTINMLPVYPNGSGGLRRSPCQNLLIGSAVAPQILKGKLEGLKVTANAIQVPTPEQGYYKVQIVTATGKTVFSQNVIGGAQRAVTANGLSKGMYMVRVNAPGNKEAVARVSLVN
jgi:hypothetical protein